MNESHAQTLLVLATTLDATVHEAMILVRRVHFQQRERAPDATEQRVVAIALVALATTLSSAVALLHLLSLNQTVAGFVAERPIVASVALTPTHVHALSVTGARNSSEERTVQPADLDGDARVRDGGLHQHSQWLLCAAEGIVGVVQRKTLKGQERRDAWAHRDVGVCGTELDVLTRIRRRFGLANHTVNYCTEIIGNVKDSQLPPNGMKRALKHTTHIDAEERSCFVLKRIDSECIRWECYRKDSMTKGNNSNSIGSGGQHGCVERITVHKIKRR